MQEDNQNRIDKWLWCIRMFKTRSLAAEACKSGKVIIDNLIVKASRNIKIDDKIQINYGNYTKTIIVKDFLRSRLSAVLASRYYEDLTPEEEYNKMKGVKEIDFEFRPRGLGRPTKKERRVIETLKNN